MAQAFMELWHYNKQNGAVDGTIAPDKGGHDWALQHYDTHLETIE